MNQNERICHEKTPKGIQTALDTLAISKPAVSPLVSVFGPVLVAKAELTARLSEDDVNKPDISELEWVRFSKGVPLLAITGRMDFHQEFKQAASMILPSMAEAFPAIQSDIEAIKSNISDNSLDASECVKAFVENNTRKIDALAFQAGTMPAIFSFALAQIAEPFMEIQARALSPLIEDQQWLFGHCPMCGSFAAIAGLIGEGGTRWLQCAVCAQEWRFSRHTCPRCDSKDNFECIFDQESPVKDKERVSACKVCNTYLLTIDLHQHSDPVNMDVAGMSMIGLDIQALEKGYSPQVETLWNSMK